MKRFATCLCLCSALAMGCSGEEPTEFPGGLEPIGENSASYPEGTAADPYPETLNLVQQDVPTSGVEARAYVKASLLDTWAAFQDPEVVVDRRGVTRWTVQHDVEPKYDVSFRTHYVIEDLITVEFDVTWRQGVIDGTTERPEQVGMRYQKTNGSTLVRSLEGSITLEAIDADVTGISWVQAMDATATSSDDIASWTRDMYDSVLAEVRGEPLPQY